MYAMGRREKSRARAACPWHDSDDTPGDLFTGKLGSFWSHSAKPAIKTKRKNALKALRRSFRSSGYNPSLLDHQWFICGNLWKHRFVFLNSLWLPSKKEKNCDHFGPRFWGSESWRKETRRDAFSSKCKRKPRTLRLPGETAGVYF